MTIQILQGNSLDVLKGLPDGSVHCCVTSPPYWGLRNYNHESQLGLESTPEKYVANMVQVFREVRRVLREDGTCWINLGDSFCSTDKWGGGKSGNSGKHTVVSGTGDVPSWAVRARKPSIAGIKPKDLVGIPWMVAFALRADGWWLRSDIVWQKPNVLPESVTDRPTKSHEYVFLLAKSAQYFYDMDAVREPCTMKPQRRLTPIEGRPSFGGHQAHTEAGYRTRDEVGVDGHPGGRNLRDVWSINTRPYKGAHFATMPPALVVPCIKAGTSERGCCPSCGAPWERQVDREKIPDRPGRVRARKGDSLADAHGQDGRAGNRYSIQSTTTGWEPTCTCSPQEPVPCTVLDPFGGSGTTAEVARSLGRDCILIELNPDYIDLAKIRLYGEREPERADLEATSDHEGPSLLEMLGM